MAKSISGLVPITSPVRANYALAIESLTDSGEETKRFGLERVSGSNKVIINSMSDFPDPISGVITLATNKTYEIANNLTTSDRFVALSGSELCGIGEGASSLTYTGSSSLITTTDIDFEIRQFKIDLSNTGTLLASTSTSGFNFIVIQDMMIFNAAKLGTITDTSISITNCNIQSFADGWTIAGNLIFFNNFLVGYLDNTGSSTTIALGTATISNFIIRDTAMRGNGIGISGATGSANINADEIADVDTTEMTIATPLSGVARDDFRWSFRNCRGVLDSIIGAESTLIVTQAVTINTQGVFEVVNGTNWVDKLSDSFTISSAGVITYIGEIDRPFKITATATIEKDTGGTNQICQRIALNGTTIADSEACSENAAPTSVTCQTTETLTKGDDINTYVSNEDGTGDVNVLLSNIIVQRMT